MLWRMYLKSSSFFYSKMITYLTQTVKVTQKRRGIARNYIYIYFNMRYQLLRKYNLHAFMTILLFINY